MRQYESSSDELERVRNRLWEVEASHAALQLQLSRVHQPQMPPPPFPFVAYPTSVDLQTFFYNPPVTPNILSILTNVVARIACNSTPTGVMGKKKASCVLTIGAASSADILAWVIDPNGTLNVLPYFIPSLAVDYRTPRLNWELDLMGNVEAVPTLLHQFRITISKDGTKLAQSLDAISDEEFLEMVHYGPLAECKDAWIQKTKAGTVYVQQRNDAGV
ncbi:hypothetical protein RhiJN_07365 [Ceratobasidium sp. AG-Ba]|nr:hypothetical protein RhiJN_07365 [Ceratobasidium sp. AG-Ba]QRW08219.1 hypothetical protein RhiLY_07218 [Ceratobasidium sp. AG-Ba]